VAGALATGRLPFLATAAILALAAMLPAAAMRFWLIEPPELAWLCHAPGGGGPWWCPLRTGLILALQAGVLGLVSAVAGARALVFGGGRPSAAVAVTAGAAGVVLYGAGLGALGAVLGFLRALRL
jgi:hypothetical protein